MSTERTGNEFGRQLLVHDVAEWRAWLAGHENESDGVWLVLAKKGVTVPTSLTYQQALEEALCSGWIDGQRRSRDEHSFLQRYTPRRARSIWSKRNVALIAQLEESGRLRTRGLAEVDRARADGRWNRAYDGPATAEPPEALTVALAAAPDAAAAFARLSRTERFSVLHPLLTAPDNAVLARRVERAIARLSGG